MKIQNPSYQIFLVSLQFGGILYFAISGSIIPDSIFPIILILISILNGVWALLTMNRKTLTVLPELRKEATLVTTGPYRFVRHPMYTSIFLFLTGLLIENFDWMRLLVFVIVLSALMLKINIEEKQLKLRFAEYKNYQLKTKQFIPFVF